MSDHSTVTLKYVNSFLCVSRHTSTRLEVQIHSFMNKDGLGISNKSTLLSHVYSSACPGSRFFIVLIWQ